MGGVELRLRHPVLVEDVTKRAGRVFSHRGNKCDQMGGVELKLRHAALVADATKRAGRIRALTKRLAY